MTAQGDYENLPSDKPYVHMIAGATAGVMEHISMYPIDLVKTRLQTSFSVVDGKNLGIVTNISSILKKEGFFSLYRGMFSVFMGAGPAHAIYFSTYELSKRTSGIIATFGHDMVMNPMEVIKQRLQVCPHRYRGFCDCLKRIITNEGFKAFYRSFPTQLLMNFPFHSCNFVVYEYMRKKTVGSLNYDIMAHLVSGGTAGGMAAMLTTPFDDPKIVELSKKCNGIDFPLVSKSYKIPGIIEAAKTIYLAAGFRGFFNGALARILISVPQCAISWSVYETFKYWLQ